MQINTLKTFVKRLLGKRLLDIVNKTITQLNAKRGNLSWSQEGEDRVLLSLLHKVNGGKYVNNGFYVDVGAHHPFRFSNTYLLYRHGWRGINVDAMPGSMHAFKKYRPDDVNLECGVGPMKACLQFYIFNEPALNTFDGELARSRANDVWRITKIANVPVVSLSEILTEYVPKDQRIDVLSIDVEGFDLEVLRSCDWTKYRPMVILVETLGISIEGLFSDPVYQYLHSLGYIAYSKTVNTTFFVDKDRLS